jgi:hypothetical protein
MRDDHIRIYTLTFIVQCNSKPKPVRARLCLSSPVNRPPHPLCRNQRRGKREHKHFQKGEEGKLI